jgi:hypothetical protein
MGHSRFRNETFLGELTLERTTKIITRLDDGRVSDISELRMSCRRGSIREER